MHPDVVSNSRLLFYFLNELLLLEECLSKFTSYVIRI